MNIYTGSYNNCNIGNLVSISGDKGKSVGYIGNFYTKLAPKKSFWKKWHDNIGILTEDENNRYYMECYYDEVLKFLNPFEVVEELFEFGNDVIMLCYENENNFCHRHLVAAWLELELNIIIEEVITLNNGDLKILEVKNEIKNSFKEIIIHSKKVRKLVNNKN